MKSLPATEVVNHLEWHLEQQKINTDGGVAVELLIPEMAERVKTLKELAYFLEYSERTNLNFWFFPCLLQ